jgi:alpha-tubulin suppressor-like RCC1 family protein
LKGELDFRTFYKDVEQMRRKTKRINLSFWTMLFLVGAFIFSGNASSYATSLTVTVPETAIEGDGVLIAQGTVNVSAPVDADVAVSLTSNDTSEVTVPATVTIPASQSSVTFDVTIIDDAVIDGTQSVMITASVAGWTPGSDTIAVYDNDDIVVASPSIAGGSLHTLALKDDGSLWAWGRNSYGELGDGTTTDSTTPVQVLNITDVVAIAGGGYHTLALRADGTVWAWGYNGSGQLGDGTTTKKTTPVQVSTLTDVVAIAGGYYHTLALKADGTLWAWGDNEYGQLGDGTTADRTTPVQVSPLTNLIAIAGGGEHSLVLKDDGTVWAWGYNYYGQLGDGTTENKKTPIQVSTLTKMVAIAAGSSHTLALRADGTLWAWGYNYHGQLGDGTTTQRTTPVPVSGPGGVGFLDLIFLSVVLPQSAIEGDGVLEGQGAVTADNAPTSDLVLHLVSGDTSQVTVPATVTIPAGDTSASFDVTIVDDTLLDGSQTVSITTSFQDFYAIRNIIQIHDNETATLTVDIPASATEGDGLLTAQGTVTVSAPVDADVAVSLTSNDSSEVTVPATVTIPTGQTSATFDLLIIDDAVIDGSQTVTITASVRAWTSGSDTMDVEDNESTVLTVTVPENAGEHDRVLADAGMVAIPNPFISELVVDLSSDDTSEVTVPTTLTIPAGHASATFDLTVIDDPDLDGTQTVTITASAVGWISGSDTIGVFDNDDIIVVSPSIAGGSIHTIALKDDGTLWAWGYNGMGQLGDGTTTDSTTPVQVSTLSNVVAITAGEYHTLAVKADGTLWAWGSNYYGQLGDGTTTRRTSPVQVSNLSNVIAIAGGGDHTLAVKADGTLWAWGNNYYGQLGDGTTTDRATPVQVSTLTNVVAITAGEYHTVALKDDGTVWTTASWVMAPRSREPARSRFPLSPMWLQSLEEDITPSPSGPMAPYGRGGVMAVASWVMARLPIEPLRSRFPLSPMWLQ